MLLLYIKYKTKYNRAELLFYGAKEVRECVII